MKKKVFLLSCVVFLIISIVVFTNINITGLAQVEDKTYISTSDVEYLNDNNVYGKLVKTELNSNELMTGEGEQKEGEVVFKLFGFIPIKRVKANVISNESVYIGGNTLGFSVKTQGVIVVGKNAVLTENGLVSPLENKDIEIGDIVTRVNGENIDDVIDVVEIINRDENVGKPIDFEITRDSKSHNINATPVLDTDSNRYKLGLWVRDDASGVGTMTFADKEDLEFGALGHPITDSETGARIDVQDGKVYLCSIVGVEKGEKGKPGEIKGVFLEGKKSKGIITKNNNYGLFGQITDKAGVVDENLMAEIGSRLTVMPGKAQLVSNISGVRELYDIEIIKASRQSKAKDKSLIIRVTDKRLLELTGGIIQGMSGSPILQNEKMVGAVTHVFVSDPKKGYGVYIDWMKT